MKTVKTIRTDETTSDWQSPGPAEISAARYYEEKFVPALFRPWTAAVIEAAGVARGDRVLDVACGTGIVAREVIAIAGSETPPAGLDLSAGMLAVAHGLSPGIEWRQGNAECLPYPDRSFDRVICQFGLMFFADRVRALREMKRVLRPGGRLAVAVWDKLDNNPGFARKVEILEANAGSDAADALRLPFCLGDSNLLYEMAAQAGIAGAEVTTHAGQARFPSIHDFVEAELRGWLPVMQVHLDEAMIGKIHHACERRLPELHRSAGEGFVMSTSAHILSGE